MNASTPSSTAKKSAVRGPRNRRKVILRWVKRGALAVLVLAVVGLIVLASLPKPVPVDAVVLERGPMEVTVDEDGRARVRDRYVVSAPLNGRMARIELHAGDPVERGAILARIAPLSSPLLDERSVKTTEAQIAAARAGKGQTTAQIVRAKATLEFAKAEAKRMKKLFDSGAVASQALEQARLAERTAAAELESLRFASRVADHELRMAQASLSRTDGKGEQLDVPAPVDGRVLKVIQENEGVIQAGTPLLELGDPAALEIVVDVLTSDAVSIKPGAKVRIDAWGGHALPGRVRLIEPSAFTRLSALGVEEQRVNAVIDLDGTREDWGGLGDGYRVEAKIVIWESDDVLTVPASAVFRQDKSWAVYRIQDNRAVLTTIEIGHRNATSIEVLSGLDLPASVLLHPSDRITDGIEVAPR